nr:MAG TPA: hypothetical protein [Caudoviricetes sp.]
MPTMRYNINTRVYLLNSFLYRVLMSASPSTSRHFLYTKMSQCDTM